MRIQSRGGVFALIVIVLATFGGVAAVSAAAPTLRIVPATQTVAMGASFTVRVVLNADVPTAGVQATINFDHSKLQITAVTRGAPFASAGLFLGASATNISTANTSGKLEGVAANFLPPASVPSGDADFLIVTFKVIACGESLLGLPAGPFDGIALSGGESTYGEPLTVTTTGGKVTIPCAGASPTATPAGASPSASAIGASPTPTTPGASQAAAPAATAAPTGAVQAVVAAPANTAPPTDTFTDVVGSAPNLWPIVVGALAAILAIRLLSVMTPVIRRRR